MYENYSFQHCLYAHYTIWKEFNRKWFFVRQWSPGQILSIVVHKVDLTPFVVTLFAHIITTRFPMIQIFWLLIRITIVDECERCWLTSFRSVMLLWIYFIIAPYIFSYFRSYQCIYRIKRCDGREIANHNKTLDHMKYNIVKYTNFIYWKHKVYIRDEVAPSIITNIGFVIIWWKFFSLYSEMDKNEIGYKKYLYYSIIIKIIVGGCIVKGKAHK